MSKPKDILKKALDGASLTNEEVSIIAKNPQCSKLYAQKVLDGRFVEGEEAIITNTAQTYLYAKDVIRGPWKKGESTLANDSWYALEYARNVTGARFPKGEKEISKSGKSSLEYAKTVIRGRFELGEKSILEQCSPEEVCYYSTILMDEKWPEAEEKILKSSSACCDYCCKFQYKWPEAELKIMESPISCVQYAALVIEGKWPEAESIIAQDAQSSIRYAKNIEERFEKGEDTIIKSLALINSWELPDYIRSVLNGERWEKLENFIENFSGDEENLISLIDQYSSSIKVKLPDFIHNRMLALAITNSDDWNVQRYFDSLETREDNEKLNLVKRFSVEKLKEILSSINE